MQPRGCFDGQQRQRNGYSTGIDERDIYSMDPIHDDCRLTASNICNKQHRVLPDVGLSKRRLLSQSPINEQGKMTKADFVRFVS